LHTSRHTSKNSSFSTQDEHLMLLGLEALTDAPNLRYATRSIYQYDAGSVLDVLAGPMEEFFWTG
jgi:hypothetical protein